MNPEDPLAGHDTPDAERAHETGDALQPEEPRDIKEALARGVEAMLAERRQMLCPLPERFWAAALGGAPLTTKEQAHVRRCHHCQRFNREARGAVAEVLGRPQAPGTASPGSQKDAHTVPPSKWEHLLKWMKEMARAALEFGRKNAAVLVLTVLLVATAAGSLALQSHTQARLDEVVAELEETRAAVRIQAPTLDSSLRELDRGREITVRASETPNELVLELSPYLGPPWYMGLDIVWDAEAEDGLEPEEVYNQGFTPLRPIITHEYELPKPGDQRRVTVALRYYLTGKARAKFQRASDVVVETIPLLLTAEGIRVAVGRAVDGVSAAITSPAENDALVPEQFALQLALKGPARTSPARSHNGDRMIHILIRPLDGPREAQAAYHVQLFGVRVSDLPASGDPMRFETWVALPGLHRFEQDREDKTPAPPLPAKFEVLVVELPLRLIQDEVPKSLMDFQDAALCHEAVRARRVVRHRPEPEEQN